MAENKFVIFLKKAGSKILAWLRSRWIGFYLLLPVVIATFVFPFVYAGEFLGGFYGSAAVMAMPFVTIAAFVLSFFRPTARFAPIVMFAMQLVTFGLFVSTSYMFLSTSFFGGITGNIFVQAGFAYSYCTLCLILGMAVTAVAACFRQYKDEKKTFFGAPAYAVKESGEEVTGE